MKLFADYKIENGYKNINIWYIYNSYNAYIKEEGYLEFKKYYLKYFKNRIFSTHKFNKVPMLLVNKQPHKNSFFRYKSNINNAGNSESITHSTYKEIIKDISILNLVVNDKIIKLYVSDSDIEYEFIANGNRYYADVFIRFYKSIPEEYFYKWRGKLLIELNKTHAIGKKKAKDCYDYGFPIFEHTISEKLLMNEHTNSEEEILQQKNFISNYLSEKIYGKLISDPISEDFIMIERLKKENNELKNKYDNLLNNNSLLINVNEYQANRIVELQAENADIKNSNQQLVNYKNAIEKKKILKIILKICGVK